MTTTKRKILILSGPTHEYFDPVRFIGNASSGKTGKALAEEALRLGLEVEFITGPVPESNLPAANPEFAAHLHIHRIVSAEEMLAAARKKADEAGILIFAAAVADYRPEVKHAGKIPKIRDRLVLALEPTPDIAAALCATRRPEQIAIGFALQTSDGELRAREKLLSKNLDAIVLNTPATLGAETGLFTWIDRQTTIPWGDIGKTDCARRILEQALHLLNR